MPSLEELVEGLTGREDDLATARVARQALVAKLSEELRAGVKPQLEEGLRGIADAWSTTVLATKLESMEAVLEMLEDHASDELPEIQLFAANFARVIRAAIKSVEEDSR